MRVRQLIRLLERFDPDAPVRICTSLPGGVIETHEQIWVGDYGGGPQIHAALNIRQFQVYVGCGFEQIVRDVPARLDLGRYDSPEDAARVRDFYVVNKGLHDPLHYPSFDYEHWIPPRTASGDYNPVIAEILREKLMKE